MRIVLSAHPPLRSKSGLKGHAQLALCVVILNAVILS